ncbi:unnamed protein product [Sphenostylis stenocarpa]|uniref:Uncharacterized protein n=1 Tax=Sphenostylis stenocarpa TaxID=92480 RepID=A0AA86SYB1_9FABA|nr:unnamed protein product [Sphenostylis stenocarpa]
MGRAKLMWEGKESADPNSCNAPKQLVGVLLIWEMRGNTRAECKWKSIGRSIVLAVNQRFRFFPKTLLLTPGP